jgi:hypothetical protein
MNKRTPNEPAPEHSLAEQVEAAKRVLADQTATLESVRAAHEVALNEIISADRQIDRVNVERSRGIIEKTDAELTANTAAAGAARMRKERAEALAQALSDRIKDIEIQLDQEARRKLYEQILETVRKGVPAIETEYRDGALLILAALRRQAELRVAIAESNAFLPRNATPIGDPDAARRDPPGAEVVSETKVSRWCDGPHVVPDALAATRVNEVGGEAWLPNVSGSVTNARRIERREFMHVRRTPAPVTHHIEELAGEISLPGFRAGEPPLWTPFPQVSAVGILGRLKQLDDDAIAPLQRAPLVTEALIPFALWEQRKKNEAETAKAQLANAKG